MEENKYTMYDEYAWEIRSEDSCITVPFQVGKKKAKEILNILNNDENNFECKWEHGKAEGLYITSCGSEWFEYGMFPIIDFKYCPKCGKLIEVVKDENFKM